MDVVRSFREATAPALLFTLWSIWGLAFAMGEVIPVNEGLGWDGVRFAKMVEGGPALLEGREINSYYVQRVGPSFAVRLMLMALGLSPGTGSIRLGFVVLNLTLLSLALVLLMDAAEAMGVNNAMVKSLAFGVSAMYTGVAGALGAIAIQFVAPDSFNIFLSITLLVGVVVGGLASITGALYGALFIQFVPNIADDISKAAPWAIFGLFLIASVYVMPAGVAGAIRMGMARLRRKRQTS